jgi:hypothetical protein
MLNKTVKKGLKIFAGLGIFLVLAVCCIVLIIMAAIYAYYTEAMTPLTEGIQPQDNTSLLWATAISEESQDDIIYFDENFTIQPAIFSGQFAHNSNTKYPNCKNERYYTCLFVINNHTGELMKHITVRGYVQGNIARNGDLLIVATRDVANQDLFALTLINYSTLTVEEEIILDGIEINGTLYDYQSDLDEEEPVLFYNRGGDVYAFNWEERQLVNIGRADVGSWKKVQRISPAKYAIFPSTSSQITNNSEITVIAVKNDRIIESIADNDLRQEINEMTSITKDNFYFDGNTAYDTNNQTTLWQLDLTDRYEVNNPEDTPSVLSHLFYDDNLILGTSYREIISIKIATGEINWATKAPTSATQILNVGSEVGYFASFGRGYGLGVINLTSGELGRPIRPKGSSSFWLFSNTILDGKYLYIGDHTGLYKFELE